MNLYSRNGIMTNSEKQDLRVQRTRHSLRQALQELMAEKSYEDITIGEITKRAFVARQTFYMHYETKNDLLVSLFGDIFTQHQREKFEDFVKGDRNICDMAESFFDFWKPHRDKLKFIFEANADHELLNALRGNFQYFHQRMVELNKKDNTRLAPYAQEVITLTSFSLLKRWVLHDDEDLAGQLSVFLCDIATAIDTAMRKNC